VLCPSSRGSAPADIPGRHDLSADEIDTRCAASRRGEDYCPSRSTRFCCAQPSSVSRKKAALRDRERTITEELRGRKRSGPEAILLNIMPAHDIAP